MYKGAAKNIDEDLLIPTSLCSPLTLENLRFRKFDTRLKNDLYEEDGQLRFPPGLANALKGDV